MFDLDHSEVQSSTATVCEYAALYGATPERGEFDSRDIWDRDDALAALDEAIRIIALGIAPDGTQLADERESMLWGFVNMLDAQTRRLDRSADKLVPDMKDLQREQDGSEIKSFELEQITARAQNLGDKRDAFEELRDAAAQPTALRPAAPGVRAADRTPAGPASSPHRPSTPATSSVPARTVRSRRTCPRERWSRSQAAGTSATLAPSSPGSIRSAPSTPTWCSCTAAAPASRRSPRAGPS